METATIDPPRSWSRRVLGWPPIRLVLAVVVVLGVAVLASIAADEARKACGLSREVSAFLAMLIGLPAVHLAYVGYVRLIEKRLAVEVALDRAHPDLAIGVLMGAGLFAAVVGSLAALGLYRFTEVRGWSVLIVPFAGAVWSAYFEEVLFRAAFFRILEEWLGTWLALLLTASLFGLLHLLNKHSTLASAAAIAASAGILLGAAYVLRGTVWLAVGIHFGWNFTEGGIFAFAVSGGGAGKGLIAGELSGPLFLTGGAFGPEASILTVIYGLVMGGAMLAVAQRRGLIRLPSWRRTIPAAA